MITCCIQCICAVEFMPSFKLCAHCAGRVWSRLPIRYSRAATLCLLISFEMEPIRKSKFGTRFKANCKEIQHARDEWMLLYRHRSLLSFDNDDEKNKRLLNHRRRKNVEKIALEQVWKWKMSAYDSLLYVFTQQNTFIYYSLSLHMNLLSLQFISCAILQFNADNLHGK